jgi:UDP-glucose 4-epimerase
MSKQTILVTGGAGYIGSHTVRLMVKKGFDVVVIDNLVYGHQDAIVDPGVQLVVGDLSDPKLLEQIFSQHKIEAVLHFAAYALVGESVTEPNKYYHNNMAAPLVLLDAMRKHGCHTFIFSSTCATYGSPQYMPMDEKHPQAPINPYGTSKLMLEMVLKDYAKAYDLKYVILRYFNASGCSADGLIGEDHTPESHLIPLILKAIKGERAAITVFGTDYDTEDGTCIRDYIHIEDLAEAHYLAYQHLSKCGGSDVFNLGTGQGYSVKQVIEVAEKVSGKKVPVVYGERREGDPPVLVANASKANTVLGWKPRYNDLNDIIRTAWAWESGPNNGRFKS